MVKIESLNLNDLKFLANKMQLDDVDTLSTEELISALKEEFTSYYDDNKFDANEKYISSLFFQDSTKLAENSRLNYHLPNTYNETIIQIIEKNPAWIYSFWSIANQDLDNYNENYPNFSLVLNVKIDGKVKHDYDISVLAEDKSWTINHPDCGGICTIYLVLLTAEGERIVLAESNKIELFESYWLNNQEEIKENTALMRNLFAPILLESGVTAYSLPLKKLLNIASDEGAF